MTFHLTCVHIISVRFRLLSDHRFGNSCSLGRLICSLLYFEGWILVRIASVPDLCILLTLIQKYNNNITEIQNNNKVSGFAVLNNDNS